ncbi:MAG TPA: hypothetical protein VGM56_26200 [Byssovorax sp.]|jgi:hypothetical protein
MTPRFVGGSRLAALALAVGLLAATGCSADTHADPAGKGTTSLFTVPASLGDLKDGTFFDMPWPCDLRVVDGFVSFEGFENPRQVQLLDSYITAMKGQLDGFSPAAAGFFRFDGAIDPSTLPSDPKAATDPSSSVQLIDIDPTSPEHGQRHLLSVEWRETEGIYWQPDTLAFMPLLGFPLRPHTRYAVVVTDKVTSKDGSPITRAAGLEQVLGLAPATGAAVAAKAKLAPAVAEVASAGIAAANIVQFTAFTTTDPTAEMFAVRDALKSEIVAPTADPAQSFFVRTTGDYDLYTGNYGPSPNYQAGTIPFTNEGDGGNFVFRNGKPVVQDLFDLRFSLTVPNGDACPMPEAGFPIALYAHGTGGDYESYVDDGTGAALAAQCVATMGIDEIFHGTRPGAPPDDDEMEEELLFFNFSNVVAARTNTRQAAVDEMQRARLFTESHMSIPASVSKTHTEIRFDASKLTFFGHSQGGLNGPLYFAADDSARGGVLSGSGADITITLLEKTSPPPSIVSLITTLLLDLDGTEATEVDFFHPAISLAQTIVDVVDPINYARYSILEPRPGFAPKSIYQTEGVNPDGTGDTYAPPHSIEAHSIALGLPPQLPEQHPIVEEQFGGPQPITVPASGLSGNLANGRASGVLAQWAVPVGDDGHFVVFDVQAAQLQAARFVANLSANPIGEVPAP